MAIGESFLKPLCFFKLVENTSEYSFISKQCFFAIALILRKIPSSQVLESTRVSLDDGRTGILMIDDWLILGSVIYSYKSLISNANCTILTDPIQYCCTLDLYIHDMTLFLLPLYLKILISRQVYYTDRILDELERRIHHNLNNLADRLVWWCHRSHLLGADPGPGFSSWASPWQCHIDKMVCLSMVC